MLEYNKPKRVAIYCRVSNDEQKILWYWMETQETQLRNIINGYKRDTQNWILDENLIFRDAWITWWHLDRPGYNKMMKMVKEKKIDIIAVYKIDRIARNLTRLLEFFEEIQKYWVSFFSLKEDIDFSWPIWRLTFQIFWALAEFERETIRTRTSEWKITSARNGNFVSNSAPFWYVKVPKEVKWKTLEVVKDEAKWVKTIFQRFVYDKMSYIQIANELNKIHLPKWIWSLAKNKLSKWHDTNIPDIIRNSAYIWIHVTRLKDWDKNTQEIKVSVPRIIDDVLFLAAESILLARKEKKIVWWWKNKYLLSRKIYYENTTRWFIWYMRTKWGSSYRHKKFQDPETWKVYQNLEVPWAPLDDMVWGLIKLAIERPEEFYKIYKKQNIQNEEIESLLKRQNYLLEEIEKHRLYILSAEDSFIQEKMSEDNMNLHISRYEKNIYEFNQEYEKNEEKIEKLVNIQISIDALNKFSTQFKNKLDNLTLDEKKVFIDLLVDRVEVYRNKDEMNVLIYFRFAQKLVEKDDDKDEPKGGSKNKKTSWKEVESLSLEAPSGIEPLYGVLQTPAWTTLPWRH